MAVDNQEERCLKTSWRFSPFQKIAILILFGGGLLFIYAFKPQEDIALPSSPLSKLPAGPVYNLCAPRECVNDFLTGVDRIPVENSARDWLDSLMERTSSLYKGTELEDFVRIIYSRRISMTRKPVPVIEHHYNDESR